MNDTVDKDTLLGFYRTKLNQVQLSYASLVMWQHQDAAEIFKAMHGTLDKRLHIFPHVQILIEDEQQLRIACEELYQSAYRSAIKELFTLTKVYCTNTSQIDALKSQSWFQFWRIIRNCWSHDMTFSFGGNEITHLPLTWSGVTIDMSMNGKQLTHGVCSYAKLYELLETAKEYVQNKIT